MSGNLDEVVQGKVSESIRKLTSLGMDETATTAEELHSIAKQEKEWSLQMQSEVEELKLQNEIQAERLQQEQWAQAIQQLKEAKLRMSEQHQKNMEQLKKMGEEATTEPRNEALSWLRGPLAAQEDTRVGTHTAQEQEKARNLQELRKQQEDLQEEIDRMTENEPSGSDLTNILRKALHPREQQKTEQELMMEQLRTALAPKTTDKDTTRNLLRALITAQNKAGGVGGTSTLKPGIADCLMNEGEFSMAKWLATLNKQEEGESDVCKLLNKEDYSDCRQECKHTKVRSGMLDKSTTNIRHKEVWPQKNLGEDWAEEEMEFKQLRFEHLVAGETRTIEMCPEPAEILGRLRLLRRIAYLHLRGVDWHLLRKMYGAILSSIETREYSWESNFDRF